MRPMANSFGSRSTLDVGKRKFEIYKLAALEKARGETAALRNLANAARLVEERPALMQLRL